jgi:hypothetical protein
MEDILFAWVKDLSPFGFTLLMVYLHYTGLLPKAMKKIFRLNGDIGTVERLANNHIPHIEEDLKIVKRDVEVLRISHEKLATYDWCEDKFKEMKTDIKDHINTLETHLNKRIDDIKD